MPKNSNITKANTKAKNNSAVLSIVNTALTAFKVTIQSIHEVELRIHEAAFACLKHAETTGDIMPMDRLIKGMQEHKHPLTKSMVYEVVAYARKNSPIRWDAKGTVKMLKPSDENYAPFDVQNAEKEPFFEMSSAAKARQAASAAHNRTLNALTFKDVLGRAKGIAKTVERAMTEDQNGDVRGVKDADKARINRFLTRLDSFIREFNESEVTGDKKAA